MSSRSQARDDVRPKSSTYTDLQFLKIRLRVQIEDAGFRTSSWTTGTYVVLSLDS
jgi:hypothetical protein